MKTLIFTFLIFSTSLAMAAQSQLAVARVPAKVLSAAEAIYEMGRGNADAGGISSVALLRNNKGLSTFDILKDVMFNSKKSERVSEIAKYACGELSADNCVRAVLTRDEVITGNHQFHDIFSFITHIRDWDFEEFKNDWVKSLDTVEQYAGTAVGPNPKVYAFGYDDQADVFAIVMISRDGKKVLVFTGDYGA